jgi:hypothetical protein
MNFDTFSKPFLIEPGTKYFLNETLKQAHTFRVNHENTLINIGLFIIFLIILGGILYYKYKGRLTPEEKKRKEVEKQQYILSKIKNFQENKIRMQQQLITGLPQWESEYDILNHNILVR